MSMERKVIRKIITIYTLWLIKRGIATHGYDIIKRMNRDGFVRIGPSHIYPLLKRLEKKGIISSTVGGKKKTYTITEEGKNILSNAFKWMRKGKKIEFFKEVAGCGKE